MSIDQRKVFVVHGRNESARRGLFDFLRSIGLDPIEWSEAIRMTGQGSPYIGEVLDAAFGAAQAVVVLQTPDDVAYLHESLTYPEDPETSPQMQPRPNVLFEAGMAMGRDADRTVIVELGKVKSFSDIHGKHVVRLDGSLTKRQELARRLETVAAPCNWWDPTGTMPVTSRRPSRLAVGCRSVGSCRVQRLQVGRG
ncbi:MAG: nucleotide-binding protein [Marmoricola sp.]